LVSRVSLRCSASLCDPFNSTSVNPGVVAERRGAPQRDAAISDSPASAVWKGGTAANTTVLLTLRLSAVLCVSLRLFWPDRGRAHFGCD